MSQADGIKAPLRVVLWGTCDIGKPRVRILLKGLRENGIEVIECRADIWSGIQDKSQVKGIGRWVRLLAGIVLAYPALLWRYLHLPRHDWILLGYPAIPDIFVIRLFAWLRGSGVAMDWFLSAYDTVVLDRGLVGRRHPIALALWTTEWLSIRLADVVFMDTRAHASRMEVLFGLRSGACASVWVGVEEAVFAGRSTMDTSTAGSGEPMRVLFYGQFIPLHGLPTIIEAARLLRDQSIDWLIIGHGQESDRVHAMLKTQALPRLRTLDWVEYEELLDHICEADVCLGVFGTSDKAASVIPNKVFQILAAGKSLITRDSPGMRELVDDDYSDIKLIEAGNASALANAVQAWHRRPPAADPCRDALASRFSTIAVGRQCLDLIVRRRSS